MDIYFKINNNILKLAGMWVPLDDARRSERIFYFVYNTIVFAYSCTLYPICESMKFKEGLTDMIIFMYYIKIFVTHIWATFKLFVWYYKRAQVFKLLDTLKESSDKIEKNWNEDLMVHRFKTMLIVSLAAGISIAGSLEVFIKLIINPDSLLQDSDLTNSTEKVFVESLPYLSWTPFEYQSSRFKYSLAALFQWHPIFQLSLIVTAFDTYYVGILSYIALQFRAVQDSFGSLRERSLRKLGIRQQSEMETDSPLLTKQMHHEMRIVSQRLQVLIKTCHDMENLFTNIMLIQTMFSLSALCSCLYMVTTLPFYHKQFAMELVYCIAVMTELFLFSHIGNVVTNDALEIPNALVYSDWYTSETSYKQSIMINMARLQKPIYFTIGKFQPISLSTFVSISKAAYSFCAVVKNMAE